MERLRQLLGWFAGRPAAALLLFLALGWVCYHPSLGGSFVWDDAFLVQNSPAIRSPALIGEVFRHYLNFDSAAIFYRPVQNLSFMGDYLLWELEPYGYRLTNLFLHIANASLLFFLLRRLLPRLLPPSVSVEQAADRPAPADVLALCVALFWLVHPVHSAAVAYISGRADSLAMGFALLAWLAWERGSEAVARRAFLPAAGLFASGCLTLLLALCSKEIATIWLALFGVYLLLGRPTPPVRRRVLAFLGALVVLGCYVALRQLPEASKDAFVPPAPPMPSKFILMGRSLGDYAGLLLCPVRLYMERQVFSDYGRALSASEQWGYHALLLAGLATLGLCVAGTLWRASGQRLRCFGAAWFLLAWLPVSNLWTLNASVAEHWLYVPSVGFLLFLAGVATALPTMSSALRWWRALALAPVALAVALALLIVRTNLRSVDWFDDVTFYRQTLAAGTRSPRTQLMLALASLRTGQTAEAETALRELAEKFPNYGLIRLNLANLLMRKGQFPEAAGLLHALRDSTSPAHRALLPKVWGNLLRLPGENPDPAATLERIDAALAGLPHSWELLEIKVRLLRQLGRPAEAETAVAIYHAARPWHYPATLLLGALAEEREDFAGAEKLYLAAGRLDVHEAGSRRARALLHLHARQPDSARELAWEAVSRQPEQAQNYLVLAEICVALGRSHEAAAATAQAARLGSPIAATP